MKMRIFSFIITFASIFSCTAVNLLGPQVLPASKFISKKKVALVGFHPYSTATAGNSLDGWIDTPCKSEISQIYGTDLKSEFFKGRRNVEAEFRAAYPEKTQAISSLSFGDPISKFPVSGWNTDISEENIKNYMDFSYKYISAGALPDLCEVFDWDAITKKFKMKKRDVDYYVVGIFTPVFSRPTVLGAITFAVSYPLSFLSLGIIPLTQQKLTRSYFRVYDSELNLVKEIKTENSFWNLSAIWVFPSERNRVVESYSYDPPVWEKDVAELEKAWKPE